MADAEFSAMFVERTKRLTRAADSIQTLSSWLQFHRRRAPLIASVFAILVADGSVAAAHRLNLIYVINDVVQNSRKKSDEFVVAFEHVITDIVSGFLSSSASQVPDLDTIRSLKRQVAVWRDRAVFSSAVLAALEGIVRESEQYMGGGSGVMELPPSTSTVPSLPPAPPPSTGALPPNTAKLIKKLEIDATASINDATEKNKINSIDSNLLVGQDIQSLAPDQATCEAFIAAVSGAITVVAESSKTMSLAVDRKSLLVAALQREIDRQTEDIQVAMSLLVTCGNHTTVLTDLHEKLNSHLSYLSGANDVIDASPHDPRKRQRS